MTMPKRVALHLGATTIEEFKRAAEVAGEIGFTHIDIAALTEKTPYQLDNGGAWHSGYDFYAEFSARFPGVFKFHLPSALSKFIPSDHAKRNLEALATRAEIASELGLRCTFFGLEPQWLPDDVYQEHPRWRGPRCDHPVRSKKPYFAPCVDDPDVLELYRESGIEIAKAAPNLDTFGFLANDSGAGVCWCEDLYVGPNGPARCRNRSLRERLGGLMEAMAAGPRDQGNDPRIFFYHRGIWSFSGMVPLMGTNADGKLAYARQPLDKPIFHENPMALLAEMEKAVAGDADTLIVCMEGGSLLSKGGVYASMIKRFKEKPSRNHVERLGILRQSLPEGIEGEAADWLLSAWAHLERALDEFSALFRKSFFFYCSVSKRWLTRPLVPFPLEIPEEEAAYYEKYIFNALGRQVLGDYLDLHGGRNYSIIETPSELRRAQFACKLALANLGGAVADAQEAEGNVSSGEPAGYLTDTQLRLKALGCLVRNFRNVMEMQAMLDKAPETAGQHPPRDSMDFMDMTNVIRDEIDNTQDLIDVLEKGEKPIFRLAAGSEGEDVFTLGPDLVEQLREKIRLMYERWRDPQKLYVRRGYRPPFD